MYKKYNRNGTKVKFLIIMLIITIIVGLSIVIYGVDEDKTTIQCNDEKMFDALREALNSYIATGDADRNNLTIKIPTSEIPNITSISLNNKHITDITGLEKLTALKNIELAKNNISNVNALQNLTSIETLDLSDNNIRNNAGNVLRNKTSIKSLNLSNNGVSDVSFLSTLTSLETLKIANGSFSSLNSIDRMTSIKNLDVSGNPSLTSITPILTLWNIEVLNISNTGITHLECITALTKLRELYISGLEVDDVCSIVDLYWDENAYFIDDEWYGDYFALLENLEILDISYVNRNDEIEMPSFSDLSYLKNLKELYMQGNNLTEIDDIYMLQSLEKLNLEKNKIDSLAGFVYYEPIYNDEGEIIDYDVIILNPRELDLSDNELKDITVFTAFSFFTPRVHCNIQYLDLKNNHISYTQPLEFIDATIQLQDQDIEMDIYKKPIDVNQYIFLEQIMQFAMKPTSKLYSATASFDTVGCTLNSDSDYQEPNFYNVIIGYDKTEEDDVYVRLNGGIADGSVIHFNIQDDTFAIDSIVFNDQNLATKINSELEQHESYSHLKSNGKIINVNHSTITETEYLDLSNANIYDLQGLENFDGLIELNVSGNSDIRSIEPIRHCIELEKLNASGTTLVNNISAVEDLIHLRSLILNNVGLTEIASIITLNNKQIEENDESALEVLDVSANNLESLAGVENIRSLRSLSATKNNISQLPDLSNLEYLERLTAYENKIEKIPKLPHSGALKYIILSNNKLNNLYELRFISSLIELDLSNNLLKDENIDDIKNIRVSQKLKIAGNKITDIDPLKTSIGSVLELDISKNKINNVSVIDSRFSSNGTLVADTQRIDLILEETDEETVSIDLPQIFTAAKYFGSYFYTSSEFETNNYCRLDDNKVIINLEELGNNVATVKIIGGKADQSLFSIVAPIQTEIQYSTEDWTNENVTATISFTNRSNVTINNNDGNNSYVFEQNGTFTFEYTDEYGMDGSKEITVTWIDKESPVITGVSNNETYYSPVTPIITDNNSDVQITLTKDGIAVEEYTNGAEIIEKGQYVLIVKDVANNTTTVTFNIDERTEDHITSETYNVDEDNNLITGIDTGITIEQFKENISSTFEYIIKDNGGEIVTDDSKKVGTGWTIETITETYTIVVKGDLNGTGEIELNDLAQAQKINLGLNQPDEIKVKAADLNKNGLIDLNDLAKLQKIILGII